MVASGDEEALRRLRTRDIKRRANARRYGFRKGNRRQDLAPNFPADIVRCDSIGNGGLGKSRGFRLGSDTELSRRVVLAVRGWPALVLVSRVFQF